MITSPVAVSGRSRFAETSGLACESFVEYVDGRRVSAIALFIGGVAGLYSVATLREFQHGEIGSTLTWVAANEARRLDRDPTVVNGRARAYVPDCDSAHVAVWPSTGWH